MPAISASAPGKIILFGEHAVVYGHPAIAVPVHQVAARALVTAEPRRSSGSVHILAPDIGLDADLNDLPFDDPLAMTVHGLFGALKIEHAPAITLQVSSTIPLAAGLGSGAAVSAAVIRALSNFMGASLSDEQVSALVYEIEKRHHGTPSGIDNTVIVYRMPVYYVRGQAVQTFRVGAPFTIVIGDTGVVSPTALAVSDLRRLWQTDPGRYESLFDAAGQITRKARQYIENGQSGELGTLMDENHRLLQEMSVSSSELDRLVQAARSAGASGAKLSGGGRGGNMIALVEPGMVERVIAALHKAGAVRTIKTVVGKTKK